MFPGDGKRRAIRALLGLNAMVSIGSAAVMAVVADWVLTPGGIVAFLVWNALIVVLMGLVIADASPRDSVHLG